MFQQDQDIFNLLLAAVYEGVIILDEGQNIVETNDSANKMFGYTKGELLKKRLNTLIPKIYHARHDSNFKSFIKQKAHRKMGQGRDVFGARKDGTIFSLEVGLYPFTIYDKNYVMALIVDITERKLIEEERNHLATIFQESLNEIYVFEEETLKFINVNFGACENLGYALEELLQMTPLDVKPNFTEKEFRDKISVLTKKNVDKIEFETLHKRKDGSTYPIDVHLQRSKLGDRYVFVAILLDITFIKDYTEKLEKTVEERTKELQLALDAEKNLNELKTRFLSLVSHEFKTPLSGILTSSMLLSKYKSAEEQEKRDKHINTISSKVHYLNNILNDFLSVEKLEKGKIQYHPTSFKLSKIVNEVVYNANMLLKEGQKIKYPEDINSISLHQDEKTIELALFNLVHNAIKYSPENSTVEIEIEQDDEKTIFNVKDQGIGIPLQDQKNIFRRYFRAKNAELTQGTGIGLNIVKSHLENLNGKIYFESTEHKGSLFTIELPNKAV
jgi:PAS domain S-box-containing protein